MRGDVIKDLRTRPLGNTRSTFDIKIEQKPKTGPVRPLGNTHFTFDVKTDNIPKTRPQGNTLFTADAETEKKLGTELLHICLEMKAIIRGLY